MRMITRFIVLSLITVMLLSTITACNLEWMNIPGDPLDYLASEPETENAVEPIATTNNRNNLQPFTRYDETVTITVGRHFNTSTDSFDSFRNESDELNNAYINMIYDELNIKLEVVFNVPFEEYVDTLNRHRQAGTLPDTFWLPNTYTAMQFFNELINNN